MLHEKMGSGSCKLLSRIHTMSWRATSKKSQDKARLVVRLQHLVNELQQLLLHYISYSGLLLTVVGLVMNLLSLIFVSEVQNTYAGHPMFLLASRLCGLCTEDSTPRKLKPILNAAIQSTHKQGEYRAKTRKHRAGPSSRMRVLLYVPG